MDLTSFEEIASACDKAARAFRKVALSTEKAVELLFTIARCGKIRTAFLLDAHLQSRRAKAHVRRWYSR